MGLSLDSKLNTLWPLKPGPLRTAVCQFLSRHLERRPSRVLPWTTQHMVLAVCVLRACAQQGYPKYHFLEKCFFKNWVNQAEVLSHKTRGSCCSLF